MVSAVPGSGDALDAGVQRGALAGKLTEEGPHAEDEDSGVPQVLAGLDVSGRYLERGLLLELGHPPGRPVQRVAELQVAEPDLGVTGPDPDRGQVSIGRSRFSLPDDLGEPQLVADQVVG